MWKKQNYLTISGFKFPIVNLNHCFLETWHAIACILQLKPATKSMHLSQICYEDCFDILTRCMDWQRMESQDVLPDKICRQLSPDTESPCVSIKPYLEPSDSPHVGTELTILSPCRGRQCNVTSEVCEVSFNSKMFAIKNN
jgi:reversion-inducing cysteine-rich kazal motif protein